MTPLPRWVFLALLLASAVCLQAHPKSDACVHLCRAQKSPKITRVCEHQRLVLQFDGGQTPIKRLFKLCLTPCSDPGSSDNRLFFEYSDTCRSFRDILILRHGCSCDSLNHEITEDTKPWRDPYWMERFKAYKKDELHGPDMKDRFSIMLKRVLQARAMLPSNDMKDKDTMTSGEVKVKRLHKYGGEELERAKTMIDDIEDLAAPTADPNFDDDYPIDWEMWCMTQCDNGQGGTACNCDIIP